MLIFPKGSMYRLSGYLRLKGVPMKVLQGLSVYYMGTWSLRVWAFQNLESKRAVHLPLVSREWKNGSNSSYNGTPFLHSLLTKGKYLEALLT